MYLSPLVDFWISSFSILFTDVNVLIHLKIVALLRKSLLEHYFCNPPLVVGFYLFVISLINELVNFFSVQKM